MAGIYGFITNMDMENVSRSDRKAWLFSISMLVRSKLRLYMRLVLCWKRKPCQRSAMTSLLGRAAILPPVGQWHLSRHDVSIERKKKTMGLASGPHSQNFVRELSFLCSSVFLVLQALRKSLSCVSFSKLWRYEDECCIKAMELVLRWAMELLKCSPWYRRPVFVKPKGPLPNYTKWENQNMVVSNVWLAEILITLAQQCLH